MSKLIDKLFAVHDSLMTAGMAHAFGGAIALAYCTEEPRGTRDIDVNIFTDSANAGKALGALPLGVSVTAKDIETTKRDGQTRLWWDDTPIDVFLNNHPYHEVVAGGVTWVPLAKREIPVLGCASLVVFKALFNRTRDWGDIEAIAETSPQHINEASAALTEMIGADDPICIRLSSLLKNR